MQNNIYDENKNVCGTGFFMLLNSSKFLISAYHIINEKIKNKSIEIEIHNKKIINLELKSRFLNFLNNQKIYLLLK